MDARNREVSNAVTLVGRGVALVATATMILLTLFWIGAWRG